MSIKQKLENLQRLKDTNQFQKYIEYIRFPNFKNMEVNSKIDFLFPITFLVGKNGSGKSSILHAIYGSPLNKSIGDYWFETDIDPIIDSTSRNRYIYGYKIQEEINEVLIQRAPREGNSDYWETARPSRSLGMINTERVPPISMSVEYLDFRAELNAFDKFFNFLEYKTHRFPRKQDYLRYFSKKIKIALDNDEVVNYYNQKNEKKVILPQNLVLKIGEILGKTYTSIEIIKHNFFKDWGYTIRVASNNIKYTEAFSGSGESAVILLLYKISTLSNNSLIILDEPETSLHPGAQRRLVEYLVDLSIRYKHQIIISTHSPDLIEEMPSNSIKTMYTNENNRFDIINSQSYRLAFIELDKINVAKKTILYEDTLVGKICEAVLSKINPQYTQLLDLQISSGGSKEIFKRISHIMDLPANINIIFDGDQNTNVNTNTDLLTVGQSSNLEFLKQLIIQVTGVEIKFSLDGGNAPNERQKIEKHLQYLNFLDKKIKYFPEIIPEDIIWNDDYAKRKVVMLLDEENYIAPGLTSKEKFYNLCIKLFGNTANYDILIDEFIIKWKNSNDENYGIIETMLTNILDN
ncbi:ATP-dependent endonuclease [Chryseobacterium zhengzhouense]|uniref:ATP-dependent endonuclease n=1 Tax=Chryseobacterium zhengzhouense TaxID=1636086 RepID=A0ABW2LS66_9FLAO